MKYLGALRGNGTLISDDAELGAATFEIDGYLMRPGGEVVASGELRMEPQALAHAFEQRQLRLRTTEGRELTVRFSAKKLAAAATSAHADFGGDLPAATAWTH